jgi:protein TonB
MPRLTPFLLASAVLHTGLLVPTTGMLQIAVGHRIEVISAYLDAGRSDTRPRAARIVPRATQSPAGRTSISTAAVAPLANQTVAPTGEQPTAIDATTRPVSPASADAAAAARVRALVLADLARHFYYPAMARARGWEGEVLLAFRVQHDGYLQAARVSRTSGFVALDQAALHSLRRVERITQADNWRLDRDLDMQIPVIYRLTDAY